MENVATPTRTRKSTNRITDAVARMSAQIAERLRAGQTTPDAVTRCGESLDMAIDEYCAFQDLKSYAHMAGDLSLEEAQTLYGYLGETPETFNRQPVHVKAVLTQVFQELLSTRIRAKRSA